MKKENYACESDVIVNIASDPLSLSLKNRHKTLFHVFEKKVSLHA